MVEKYQRGKIYKIISPNTDKIYIGSTTETLLSHRIREHRSNYVEQKKGPLLGQVGPFMIIDAGNSLIILIELFPCKSRAELKLREQYHITLNTINCISKDIASPKYLNRQYCKNKHVCECGITHTVGRKMQHEKTILHQKYINGENILLINRDITNRPCTLKTAEQREVDKNEYMRTYYTEHKDKIKAASTQSYQKRQRLVIAARAAGIQA